MEIRVVDIMTALATASQGIKLANDLRGIDKALNEAEFKMKIADLTVALSDIKMALSEAKDNLVAKQSEIDKLKKTFHRFSDTVELAGYKYDKRADGSPKGMPYCPVCEQKSGLLIHLTSIQSVQHCPSSKANYQRIRIFANE